MFTKMLHLILSINTIMGCRRSLYVVVSYFFHMFLKKLPIVIKLSNVESFFYSLVIEWYHNYRMLHI